jgi:hypothetical protein
LIKVEDEKIKTFLAHAKVKHESGRFLLTAVL